MSGSEPAAKRKRKDGEEENEVDKDAIIASLKAKNEKLEGMVENLRNGMTTYYSSSLAQQHRDMVNTIPDTGIPARHAKEGIEQMHLCDFKPRLNTSSYVNVTTEPEERDVALLGLQVNIADASVYPASVQMHDTVVNMIAQLWNAPPPPVAGDNYCGAGTVGSTEACLLAGLALKFRWREWYGKKNNLSKAEVDKIRPNLVMSTAYQAAWEKFFRYFDVDAKFAKPNLLKSKMAVDPKKLAALCDEKTIGVVAIMGNHYNGVYDPVWDIDAELKKLNKEKGYQVGIHVDGASGGFIAPFQQMGPDGPPTFDFRLDSVLSMSTSGHKFGESICGTGWVIFRQREGLASHIAVSVTYLGGRSDSMTLNFSRPASGPYVQLYKLMRLGKEGYRHKVENQMAVAKYLRSFIRDLKHPNGKARFQLLDGGDKCCLPVVAARLNPELKLTYDDIDLQHALSESHWYVSGYSLGFENFQKDVKDEDEKTDPIFTDAKRDETMFRIVVKSNLTMMLADDLKDRFLEVITILDSMPSGYHSMRSAQGAVKAEALKDAIKQNTTLQAATTTMVAGGKFMHIVEKAKEKQRSLRDRPLGRRRSLHGVC